MKIGVFDSGVGGRNVLEVLQAGLPEHEFYYACDEANVPYGSKTPEQIIELVRVAIRPLIDNCNLIVIACNTATSYAIDTLRQESPDITFVGLEPAIKPAAAATKSGVIAVCATPATLASPNYQRLKCEYANHITVVEPNCANWAGLIEHGQSGQISLERLADSLLAQECDVVVLGCTHYHALVSRLAKLMPGTNIIEPSDAVLEQVKRSI